jgi:hypothetical protein
MADEGSRRAVLGTGPSAIGGLPRLALASALAAVIAGATWLGVHQYTSDVRRESEREALRNEPPGARRAALSSAELAELAQPLQLDTRWLDAATKEQGLFLRTGSGDRVVVYAVVPARGCHADALEVLRSEATKHEGQVRVAAFLLGSEAADRIGPGTCARYIVNGARCYTYRSDDGTERTAVFEGKPEQSWTERELEQAVEAALSASAPLERGAVSPQG